MSTKQIFERHTVQIFKWHAYIDKNTAHGHGIQMCDDVTYVCDDVTYVCDDVTRTWHTNIHTYVPYKHLNGVQTYIHTIQIFKWHADRHTYIPYKYLNGIQTYMHTYIPYKYLNGMQTYIHTYHTNI